MGAPRITALRADHLPAATLLSTALAWPYREADWRFAFALGHGHAMELDERLVATALWWPYGSEHASFGMIIVAPEMQGHGLGRELMDALLGAAAGRTAILHSTAEGLRLYERSGFEEEGQICQHQAILRAAPAVPDLEGSVVRPMVAGDQPAVLRLDALASGMDRSKLMDALFSVGAIVVCDGDGREDADGRARGYACLRRFGHGVVIGPVVARDRAAAQSLIATLAGRCQGVFLRVDVPESSGLSPWLAAIGLPRVGDAVAMRRGPCPPVAEPRLFALANQSLG
jgi:GNAT superfamily N-acetyltransferase